MFKYALVALVHERIRFKWIFFNLKYINKINLKMYTNININSYGDCISSDIFVSMAKSKNCS